MGAANHGDVLVDQNNGIYKRVWRVVDDAGSEVISALYHGLNQNTFALGTNFQPEKTYTLTYTAYDRYGIAAPDQQIVFYSIRDLSNLYTHLGLEGNWAELNVQIPWEDPSPAKSCLAEYLKLKINGVGYSSVSIENLPQISLKYKIVSYSYSGTTVKKQGTVTTDQQGVLNRTYFDNSLGQTNLEVCQPSGSNLDAPYPIKTIMDRVEDLRSGRTYLYANLGGQSGENYNGPHAVAIGWDYSYPLSTPCNHCDGVYPASQAVAVNPNPFEWSYSQPDPGQYELFSPVLTFSADFDEAVYASSNDWDLILDVWFSGDPDPSNPHHFYRSTTKLNNYLNAIGVAPGDFEPNTPVPLQLERIEPMESWLNGLFATVGDNFVNPADMFYQTDKFKFRVRIMSGTTVLAGLISLPVAEFIFKNETPATIPYTSLNLANPTPNTFVINTQGPVIHQVSMPIAVNPGGDPPTNINFDQYRWSWKDVATNQYWDGQSWSATQGWQGFGNAGGTNLTLFPESGIFGDHIGLHLPGN